MRIMPIVSLILNMRNVDRDPSRFLFRRVVNLIVRFVVRPTKKSTVLRDRCRQRRLPVVDVPHRPNIQMRLTPVKLLLRHVSSPWSHFFY